MAELEEKLEKAKEDAIIEFKSGAKFKSVVEDVSVDKFTDGYEACIAFAEEKGLDTFVIQLADYANASMAKEMVEDLTVDDEEI